MSAFAEGTTVSSERSRAEIEALLNRHGATAFGYLTGEAKAAIQFQIGQRIVQITLTLPDRKDKRFWYTKEKRFQRTQEQAYASWEQECRRLWRALLLLVKAKLEAVASGISTIENEFLADTLLPNKMTVGATIRAQIEEAYRTGGMPRLLGPATEVKA